MEWKNSLESRSMKVNIGKTNLIVTGKKSEVIRSGRYPCGYADVELELTLSSAPLFRFGAINGAQGGPF